MFNSVPVDFRRNRMCFLFTWALTVWNSFSFWKRRDLRYTNQKNMKKQNDSEKDFNEIILFYLNGCHI